MILSRPILGKVIVTFLCLSTDKVEPPEMIPPLSFHYGSLISMKEAQKTILSSFHHVSQTKIIPVKDAKGHVLAESVLSQRTIPPVPLAGIDGIAVRSKQTKGASPEDPREIEYVRVNVGLPMPEGFDAVVTEDVVRMSGPDRGYILTPVAPHLQVIKKGAEVTKGQVVIQSDQRLIPYDIATLSHFGIRNVKVKKWKIGLIATGDEIVPLKKDPLPGQIADTNTIMISEYLRDFQVLTDLYPIIPDDPDLIAAQISTACDNSDMVLVFGGSSKGSKDCTFDAIKKSGSVLFHGVAMHPGTTVSCGIVNEKPVFGMPGQAIASLIAFFNLVLPLLKSWDVPIPGKKHVFGEITEDILPCNQFDLFHLITIRYTDGKIRIIPIPWEFGHMTGMAADGILHLPQWSNGFRKGEMVQVLLLR